MRNFIVVALAVIFFAAGAVDCVAADAGASGRVGVLVELLRNKGLISAEEQAMISQQVTTGAAQPAEIKALTDLLRTKGLISEEEAAAFLNGKAGEPSEEGGVAPGTAEQLKVADSDKVAQYDEELMRYKLKLFFLKQGVLESNEVEQIAERIGRKWSLDREDDLIAAEGSEIDYYRTTSTKEDLFAEIDELLALKLISRDEAERIKTRLTRKLSLERVADDIGVEMRKEVVAQVKEKIIPVPEWTNRITLGGDFRLRYQSDFYEDGNALLIQPAKPTELMDTQNDQQYLRVRARLNVAAKINDELVTVIGLATGNTTNPVSTNASLGDTLNKKNFLLDLAYLKWQPVKDLTLLGGRFTNPWFCTDLVWDQDVNFDGVAFSYKPEINSSLDLFLTGGAFPIQDIYNKTSGKWLYAGQLGMRYRNDSLVKAALGVAIYDYENTVGQVNTGGIDVSTGKPVSLGDKDWTAPQYQQKGNTLINIDPTGLQSNAKMAYAAEFRELNITGSLDLGFWDPLRVVLTADYVNNIGYDSDAVNTLTGQEIKKETEGYQFGVAVGYPETRSFGQWKALLTYKYLEPDAVMDAFTDSDFHLGGTNAEGWIIGGDFGVAKNTWLSTRWLTTNEVSGPPLAIDVFQFNVNARF